MRTDKAPMYFLYYIQYQSKSADLLDLIQHPCFQGVKNVSVGTAGTSTIYIEFGNDAGSCHASKKKDRLLI